MRGRESAPAIGVVLRFATHPVGPASSSTASLDPFVSRTAPRGSSIQSNECPIDSTTRSPAGSAGCERAWAQDPNTRGRDVVRGV